MDEHAGTNPCTNIARAFRITTLILEMAGDVWDYYADKRRRVHTHTHTDVHPIYTQDFLVNCFTFWQTKNATACENRKEKVKWWKPVRIALKMRIVKTHFTFHPKYLISLYVNQNVCHTHSNEPAHGHFERKNWEISRSQQFYSSIEYCICVFLVLKRIIAFVDPLYYLQMKQKVNDISKYSQFSIVEVERAGSHEQNNNLCGGWKKILKNKTQTWNLIHFVWIISMKSFSLCQCVSLSPLNSWLINTWPKFILNANDLV